jgi:uridine phosphorylase
MIPHSELILNSDGSVYHLALQPDQIADTIITVGDPDRVDDVVLRLDSVEFSMQKREFKTVTGRLDDKRLTVISTGIGTDNIDIVFNELDALANIDLHTRLIKPTLTPLTFIRLGTSGAIRSEIAVDSLVVSDMAVGLDGLMHFYKRQRTIREEVIEEDAQYFLGEELAKHITPYAVSADPTLVKAFKSFCIPGITVTATGFYAPQGRVLRYRKTADDFLTRLAQLHYGDLHATNLEMETAGIYGLSSILGHRAISINAIMANRVLGQFSKKGGATIDKMIDQALPVILGL